MNPELQSASEAAEPTAEVSETVAAPAPLPSLGELMIAARERWNLSAGDVARQLRLGLRQVEALEENRFEQLPGAAQNYLNRMQQVCGVPRDIISTGPDREQTIVRRHPFVE